MKNERCLEGKSLAEEISRDLVHCRDVRDKQDFIRNKDLSALLPLPLPASCREPAYPHYFLCFTSIYQTTNSKSGFSIVELTTSFSYVK